MFEYCVNLTIFSSKSNRSLCPLLNIAIRIHKYSLNDRKLKCHVTYKYFEQKIMYISRYTPFV